MESLAATHKGSTLLALSLLALVSQTRRALWHPSDRPARITTNVVGTRARNHTRETLTCCLLALLAHTESSRRLSLPQGFGKLSKKWMHFFDRMHCGQAVVGTYITTNKYFRL